MRRQLATGRVQCSAQCRRDGQWESQSGCAATPGCHVSRRGRLAGEAGSGLLLHGRLIRRFGEFRQCGRWKLEPCRLAQMGPVPRVCWRWQHGQGRQINSSSANATPAPSVLVAETGCDWGTSARGHHAVQRQRFSTRLTPAGGSRL